MDFSIPESLMKERDQFKDFLNRHLTGNAAKWYQEGSVPRSHYPALARGGWFGFKMEGQRMVKLSTLREALLMEQLAILSPGLAIATLVHEDLGIMGLWLFGSELLLERYGPAAVSGETLLCLGNTESGAGSDAGGITTRAEKVDGGWLLNGAKSYITSGSISDLALITAVTRPEADANSRLSMFLVDLGGQWCAKKKAEQAGMDPVGFDPDCICRRLHS